ncbi:putative glycolipid-binding domain-containing protein [Halobacillus sp. ACCC02827]|uniref:putative glycolipid-binding domain-containing protein n=1 Tax=Halobacillus sp. ACCC02827 TaxID=3052090 RepID=UPI00256FAD06|nr:putative glycolipid-binding domain-containing protein [Halobacillus sp. ACCC02827]WJE14290.1 putative glycolipid-binding domain-containing protein [Halobacillus sp. ACCC02827]
MEQKLLWTNFEDQGAEFVTIKHQTDYMQAEGTVLLVREERPVRIRYSIKLGSDWKTKKVKIYKEDREEPFVVQTEKEDKWYVNGCYDENMDGATNVDLSITPLSNMFPINRVSWEIGQKRTFKMVYIDVWKEEAAPVLQTYTYLGVDGGERVFQYKCREYETKIFVDESGVVMEYPRVFTLAASAQSEESGEKPPSTNETMAFHAFY